MGCDKIVTRKPLATSTDGGIVSRTAPSIYETHSEKIDDTAQTSRPSAKPSPPTGTAFEADIGGKKFNPFCG